MPGDTVYDSRSIANYLIGKAGARGLDPLQVLKLTYIAHGFTLGLTGRALLEDEIEAWKFGPVVRRIYSAIPGGSAPITAPIAGIPVATLKAAEHKIVDGVFEQYGSLGGMYLSSLTHRPGSPWEKTWNTYGKNAVIPKTLIQSHYKSIIDRWNEAHAQGKTYSPDAL